MNNNGTLQVVNCDLFVLQFSKERDQHPFYILLVCHMVEHLILEFFALVVSLVRG